MARGTSKTENKTVAEKAGKALSPKRQIEADHLAGKHKANGSEQVQSMAVVQNECGFCQRRLVRSEKKTGATKRFLAGAKK